MDDAGREGPTFEVSSQDIEYLRHDGTPLLARLYRPAGAGPFPGVVEVHGGAWVNGDRLNNAVIAQALAGAGAVVMSLDFRMPPAHKYPASIADINFGIRWLKVHASDFAVRADRVGALASSSGGHQLMLTALKPRDPRYAAEPLAGGHDARLGFVVLCWPVADPLARFRMAQAKGIDRFLQAHAAYFADEAQMVEGNPQLVLERGEAVDLPSLLILQGTNDDNLTPDMADRFAAAYRKAGGAVELHKFEGEPHMFITKDPTTAAAQNGLALIKAWMRQQAQR